MGSHISHSCTRPEMWFTTVTSLVKRAMRFTSSRRPEEPDSVSWQNGRVAGQDGAYDVADIEFDAEGARLRGWLYRPRSGASAAPVVVMAHGYNCLKEFYLDKYAASIASAGHVVLAYDHRNFGDSDGQPRQELDPWVQVRDYRHAIT